MRDLFKSLLLVLTASVLFGFTACVTDAGGKKDEGDSSTLTAVSITASANSIAATGSLVLTASPEPSDVSATYTWSITSGSSYATLSATSGNSVILTGKNTYSENKSVTVKLSAAAGSVTKTSDITISVLPASQTQTAELQSVSISGTSEIEAEGTGTVTATPSFSSGEQSGSVTYSWEITSGGDYATISGTGASATITGTNSTDSSQSVTVKVTATYGTTSKTANHTVTVAAAGVVIPDEITSVTLNATATSIGPSDSVTLTPVVNYTGSVTESDLTVDGWAITAGSEYAELQVPSTGAARSSMNLTGDNTSKLKGKNTTTSAQTVTATVSVTFNGVTKTGTCTVTLGAASVDSVSISGTTTLSAYNGTTELTADVSKTGSPANISYNWEITEGSDYAEITAGASTAQITLTGTNETSSARTVTVKVTVSDGTNSVTNTQTVRVPRNPNNTTKPALFPENGSTDAYADTQLVLTFTSTPTLVSGNSVTIYTSTGTLVDTINILPTSDDTQSTQSGYSINTGNQQLVRVSGNSVYIQPHYNGSSSATVLSASTSYYVEIPAAAITTSGTLKDGTAWNGFSGTSGWTFTTKAAPAISTSSAITVSNDTSSTDADFFSVYGALCAAATKSSGTYEIDIAATDDPYYELISVQGKGAHIILKGQGTETYGSDVVIEYVNNVYMNNSTHTRPSFYFKGSGNLTFENVTLKNLTQRKTSYTADNSYTSNGSYQAEALYYACSSGYMNAYNSSFVSLQDTILTAGDKAWFYGCYVAGDVDFMWGTTSVALFENCAIECLNTSATSAYLFETRVGSTSGTSVGKGYVLLNSTVTVDSGVTAYYARRATGKSSTSYYDQAAIVNSTFSGSGSLAAARWYDGNEPEYLSDTLYGTSADVGWKEYGVTNSTATSSTASTSVYGTITSTEYTNEYSGRHAILNRYYDITNDCYAKDSSTNWDIDSLISDRSYSCTEDTSEETLDGESIVTTVTYDFTAQTTYSAWDSITSIAAEDDSTNTATVSGLKWHSTNYGANVSAANSTVSFAVTGACTVTVYNSYTVETDVSLAVGGATVDTGSTSGSDSCTLSYTGTTSGTAVVTIASSGAYISKIVVTYTSSGSTSSGDENVTEDSWTLTSRTDSPFSSLSTESSTLSDDATVAGTNAVLNLTLTSAGTDAGTTQNTPKYKYDSSKGLCIKYDALKITGITGNVTLTIQGRNNGGSERNLEVTLSDDTTTVYTTALTSSSDFTYTKTFTGDDTTLYIGASNETFINTITIASSSSSDEVSSVTISGKTSVEVGSSITLTATPNVSTSSAYTWTVTGGTGSASGSSTTNTLTLTGVSAGTVTVTAAVDGVTSAAYTVTVKEAGSSPVISASDVPVGFASAGTYTTTATTASYGSYDNPVTTYSQLVAAIKAGGLIYVKGMIPLAYYESSDGTVTGSMLPSTSGGTTSALDAFVADKTSYADYDEWKAAYIAACETDTDDESYSLCEVGTLYNAYKKIVQLNLISNTTLIGIDSASGLVGGTLSISNISNVAIRNLILRDAYDPFPHHEAGDGWNSQYDGIVIQNTTSGIWIDHCTIEDTMNGSDANTDYVTNASGTKEHWNPYDGQCDIKGTANSVTVSYCKFKNHDKSMLICSGESDTGTKNVTIMNCGFYGITQRTPLVGHANVHMYNCYFDSGNGNYKSSYAIGCRYAFKIIAENNYFTSAITNSVLKSSSPAGSIYLSGNTDNSKSGVDSNMSSYTVDSVPFDPGYDYSDMISASEVPENIEDNAGAGAWEVEQ